MEIKEVKDPFADKVKCGTCKHWIDKVDAQEITVSTIFGVGFKTYFCPMHKLPYTIARHYFTGGDLGGKSYIKYYVELEVSKDGTPVGYTKIKK